MSSSFSVGLGELALAATFAVLLAGVVSGLVLLIVGGARHSRGIRLGGLVTLIVSAALLILLGLAGAMLYLEARADAGCLRP